MSEATLRFYGELNDFLPPESRQLPVAYTLNGPVAVKHIVEALGIPHTEVDLILANGEPVNFSYMVGTGDRLSVYPPFTNIKLGSLPRLRRDLPHPPRFVIDVHLGRLTTYMRLLGFDALYQNDYDDEELAAISHQEGRILLTRDRRLLMRKVVTHGYCLRTKDPQEQLLAIMRRFKLRGAIRPWHRCLRCNGELVSVEKEKVLDRLEPKTKKYYDEFHICQLCQQIYWKGSHFEPLERIIESARLGQE